MFDFAVPILFQDVALLMVRILLAVTFLAEARIKFRDMKAFSKNDGVPILVGYAVATAELAAAFAMLTGVLAQWAGIGLVLLMSATICLHIFKWRSPYWANKKGWEYDLLMLVLAAVVVVFGAGQFVLLG